MTPAATGVLIRVCILWLVVFAGCTRGDRTYPKFSKVIYEHACPNAVTEKLLAWGATDEIFNTAPTLEFLRQYRIPTDTLGIWILLDIAQSGIPHLSRVHAAGLERAFFDRDCRATTSSSAFEVAKLVGSHSSSAMEFSDVDLRASLITTNGHRGTLIYVWSPHMPLSIDGYAEIATAAESTGLNLIPVLFAGSDRDFAEREATRVSIPPEGLRELAAIELIFRDAHVHAPTVIVHDGHRFSSVLPGYRRAEGYRHFIENFLSRR